ncbi:MAG: anaphase promoting complex subunit doc1 [Pleopsidium flavum]|nr:MAG: anaphase promoting complex subunit doc1 [Pleopsidium flavum]
MEEAEIEEGDDDDDGDDEKPSATDLSNLREISSLASWTVSTYKPSCGIAALRHPSPSYFWQSDGPQPHLLNIHFFKLVSIVKIRVYLDFELDESYTPTKMVFLAGMGAYDLTEFGVWEGEGPRGWVEVELGGVGGGDGEDVSEEDEDEGEGGMKERERERGGGVLRAMLVQVRVCENHQNGKDTHVRGLQIFARDEKGRKGGGGVAGRKSEGLRDGTGKGEVVGLEEPEWMREPELR